MNFRLTRTKWVLLLLALLALTAGGWWALPRVVDAMPGEYRRHLPEEFLRLISTPLPTALPAPELAARPAVTIPALPTTTPTAVPSSTASPILVHTQEQEKGAERETAAPTATETALPTPTTTATPPPLPAQVRLEGLKIIPQKFNNCGPANLTVLLNYYGHERDQLDIAAAIRPTYEDRNVSPWELAAYVSEQTPLEAAVFSGGDRMLLKQLLAAGFPVIIEKGLLPSEWQGWMGHYLTLIGYDDTAQAFISLDTFLGPWDSSGRLEDYKFVDEYWTHFNDTFLVVFPPERQAEMQAVLGATMLDPVQMYERAVRQAQADLQADPENAFAWFNVGTSLTHLGRLTGENSYYGSAAAAFDQARTLGLPWRMLWYQFQPYVAYLENGRYQDVLTLTEATLSNQGGRSVEETYLYRGHALRALGQTDQAIQAYRNAVAINPNLEPAKAALTELEG